MLNLASWDPRGPTAIDDQESVLVAWVVTLGYDWLGPVLTPAERVPFEVISSSSRVRITQGTQSLCIDMLAGPPRQFTPISAPDYGSWGRSNDSMNDVSAAPSDPNAAAQYHGKFASTQTSTAAEFIALMRVNVECNDTAPTATKTNDVWTVQLDNGATVTIAADGKRHVSRVRIHRAQPR